MIRTYGCAIAAVLLSVSSAASADEASELALSRQIVAGAYPENQFGGTMDAMSAQMMNSITADMPPAVRTIVREENEHFSIKAKAILSGHIPAMMDALAHAYRDEFSEAELQDIAEFIATETGSSFIIRSTKLIADPAFAKANEAYIGEIMTIVPEMQKRVETRVRAYLEAQQAD